jgi:hypothetical protein
MNKIRETKINCKDLKVYVSDSREKEMFTKEICLLLKSTVMIDATTNDGVLFMEGKKSWRVIVDYVNIEYLLMRNKLFLTFTDDENIKYSGEAFITGNCLIQGTGELYETK